MIRATSSAGRFPISLPVSVTERITGEQRKAKIEATARGLDFIIYANSVCALSVAFAVIRIAHIGRNRFHLKEKVSVVLFQDLHIDITA